jgi:energy-coupling factor transporter ATP-binding protein EcfA2
VPTPDAPSVRLRLVADASAPPAVELRGVSKRWHRKAPSVFDGIDMSLAAGTAVLLTGRNGGGKTTLLRVASGLITPDCGDVKVRFDPLLDDCLAAEDRRVVTRLLGAADAEVASLADRAGARALLDDAPSPHPGGPTAWTRDVWRLATAECWLRSQAHTSFPRTLLDELSGTDKRPARRPARAGRSYVSQP